MSQRVSPLRSGADAPRSATIRPPALARHLTKGRGEACPLILDDVVGASDSERKQAVLETLLAISESNQVILFTHEDAVRDWARERLTGPPHSVVELDGSAIAP